MRNRAFILVILVLVFVSGAVGVAALRSQTGKSSRDGAVAASVENTYDRMMRTRVIRCAYVSAPPHLVVDPGTKRISGPIYDIATEMARLLEMRIEWTEEVTWQTMFEGFVTKRYDAICSHLYDIPSQAPKMEFIGPYYFSHLAAWVRSDDHRFDGRPQALNATGVKIAAIDGSMAAIVQPSLFPQASLVTMPSINPNTYNLMNVINGKADVTLMETPEASAFLKHHPGALRNAAPGQHIMTMPIGFAVAKGEFAGYSMLNSVMQFMVSNGIVESIMHRYADDETLADLVLPARVR